MSIKQHHTTEEKRARLIKAIQREEDFSKPWIAQIHADALFLCWLGSHIKFADARKIDSYYEVWEQCQGMPHQV